MHSFAHAHPSEMAARLEAGTLNAHGLAGLSAALEWLEGQGLEPLRRREQALARRFYEGVRAMPEVKIYGDWETPNRAAIVALNLGDEDAGAVADALWEDFGICTARGRTLRTAHARGVWHRRTGDCARFVLAF